MSYNRFWTLVLVGAVIISNFSIPGDNKVFAANGPTLIAHAKAMNGCSSSTSTTIDTSGANFLTMVTVDYAKNSATDIITDSKGNTWQHLNNYSGSNANVTIWYVVNPVVGSGHSFTAKGGCVSMFISAWSGMSTVLPFDVQNGNGCTSCTSLSTGSVSPTTGNVLVITGYSDNNTSTLSINSGFTILDTQRNASAETGGVAYLIQPTATTVNPSWSSVSNNYKATIIAAFKGVSTAPDTIPPIISGVTSSAITSSSATILWTTDENSDSQVEFGTDTSYGSVTSLNPALSFSHSVSLSNLLASTTYHYSVKSIDGAGNLTMSPDQILTTTGTLLPDTTPPSVPANMTVTAVSSSQVSLSWNASTDDIGVTGYKIYRGGVQIATTTSLTYLDTALTPATSYIYSVSSFDATGNSSIQSTGVSTTTLNAGPGTPLPTNTWISPLTNGFPIEVVGWEKLVYAPSIKKAVMLANYHEFGSEPNQALVGYNFSANRWDVLSMGGGFHTENMPETGHPSGMFDYNPNNNTIVYYCCHSGSSGIEVRVNTWWFDLFGQVGRDKQTLIKPALSPEGTAAFDAAHNVFVLRSEDSTATWIYDPITNTWQSITTFGTKPPALADASMVYNSNDQKIYLFGGRVGYGVGQTFYNDIYTYDVPSRTWTKLNPVGAKPAARQKAAWAYDSTNNIFLMFGGNNDSGIGLDVPFGDTWVFSPANNTWTQLNLAQSPVANGPFERMTYDSDNNAFVLVTIQRGGYAGGNWGTYAAKTWLFRYAGGGPNVGSSPTTPQPAPGSINRNADAWAKEPALASNGTSLYLGWAETGSPFDATNNTWSHAYANQLTNSGWTTLGSSGISLDSEAGGITESHTPSMTIINGTPWISWYKFNNTSLPRTVYVKQWNGSSWIGGSIGFVNSTGSIAQGRSQLIGIGATPYVAFQEISQSTYPWTTSIYVKSWNGSAWSTLGGSLNRNQNTTGAIGDSVSITSDGTNPIVAWTEYVNPNFSTNTSPQVYVSKWNGFSWQPLGASLNISTTSLANDVSISYLNNQPYVSWIERTQSGTNQVYVKTWDGTSWVMVGSGSLNKDTTSGWSYRPSLVADQTSNSLYLAWVEQQNLGQKPQTYVSQYTGSSWIPLGGTLNTDGVNGSSEHVSLVVLNGLPVVAWGEVREGSLRQIYSLQWNGSSWVAPSLSLSGIDTVAPTIPTALSATPTSSTQIQLSWSASTDNVAVGGYQIFRDGLQIATSTSASYSDSGLVDNMTYTYAVSAFDLSGNVSSKSTSVQVTTFSIPNLPPVVNAGTNQNIPLKWVCYR